MKLGRVVAAVGLAALVTGGGAFGCGDDEASSAATTGGAGGGGGAAGEAGAAGGEAGAGGAGPTRSYAIAATGARLVLGPPPSIQLTDADLATDVDAVLVHQEFYGLPWEAFEAGEEPPAEWTAVMDDLAESAQAIGPVFLSLQLVSGPGRRFLADRTVVERGLVKGQAGWSAECFDFAAAPEGPAKRAAYVAYVDWMVRRFEPRWVNVAIEMNLFGSCGDPAWSALVDVERAAYDAAKAVDPRIIAFPSIQIDVLYGFGPTCPTPADPDACFDVAYAMLADVARDRFAVTSFPYLVPALTGPGSPAFAPDWLTRAGDRGGEATIVAETGWLAAPMEVLVEPTCTTAITADERTQLAWFEHLIETANAAELELVTWASDRDLLPSELMDDCPCTFDAAWCAFLDAVRQSGGVTPEEQASAEYGIKVFGAMGLRHYDGRPRAALHEAWVAARALPWAGAVR